MNRGDAPGDEAGEDFDNGVCADESVRRSWVPVEAPRRPREPKREGELVRVPEREDGGVRGDGERGGRDA